MALKEPRLKRCRRLRDFEHTLACEPVHSLAGAHGARGALPRWWGVALRDHLGRLKELASLGLRSTVTDDCTVVFHPLPPAHLEG